MGIINEEIVFSIPIYIGMPTSTSLPSTGNPNNWLKDLKVEGKTLILLPEKNETVQKSARNIENVKTTLVNTINVYDLLKYNKLVVTLDTVKKLEEVYA